MLDKSTLPKLWLVGRPKGQSSLDPSGLYCINASWPSSERAKFRAHKEECQRRGEGQAGTSGNLPNGSGVAAYTDAERDWIKKHYESEFKFVLQHGLKMFDEGDREEGRRIVRAMMSGYD